MWRSLFKSTGILAIPYKEDTVFLLKGHSLIYLFEQFQKRRYAKLEKFRCGKKGFGLRSLDYIVKGQFLIEYVGEVMSILFFPF